MKVGKEAGTRLEDKELQKTLNSKRHQLRTVVGRPELRSWFLPCVDSEQGTVQLLDELEREVERDSFVQTLETERKRLEETCGQEGQEGLDGEEFDASAGNEVLNQDWWDPVVVLEGGENRVEEVTGDYVVINHDDVVNALANFLAAYIIALPEGKRMEPKQLQKAVKDSLREIRKGKVRKLWDWGRWVYRAAALGYGAFAAYTNPWVAEAVVKTLFTCARFARAFW